MPLLIVLGAAVLFYIQGIGFSSWMFARYKIDLKGIEISTALILGLIFNLFLFTNAYYLFPHFTMKQLSFPLNLIAGAISISLLVYSKRFLGRPASGEIITILLSIFAIMLILRPLLGIRGLGFYYSNNGEFQYYAALADAIKFNPSDFDIGGPFGIHSRESYTSIVIAEISSLVHVPTLWVTQPIAGLYTLIFFTTLTALIRTLVPDLKSGKYRLVIYSLLVSLMFNSTTQLFFSLSFVSQYLAMAIILGVFLLLRIGVPKRGLESPVYSIVIGITNGSLLLIYPEMYPINITLIVLYLLLINYYQKNVAIRSLAKSIVIIVLVGFFSNIEGTKSLFSKSLPTNGGWNIFGPIKDIDAFTGNLFGLSNPFFGPLKPSIVALVCLVILLFAGFSNQLKNGKLWNELRIWRGLLFTVAAFIPAIYAYIYFNQLGTNYILLKFILGNLWLGYIFSIMGLANRRKIGSMITACAIVLFFSQVQVGATFSKSFGNDAALSTLTMSDAIYLQQHYRELDLLYVPPISPYIIPGNFMIQGENLFRRSGSWTRMTFEFSEEKRILLLGKKLKVSDDPLLTANYEIELERKSFTVLQKE